MFHGILVLLQFMKRDPMITKLVTAQLDLRIVSKSETLRVIQFKTFTLYVLLELASIHIYRLAYIQSSSPH